MPACFLKRVLPFALALCAGAGLTQLLGFKHPATSRRAAVAWMRIPHSASCEHAAPLPPPEIHVLSTDLISENVVYAATGKIFEGVKIVTPAASQFTSAGVRSYSQGVMQLSARFGPDGEVSEITPLGKRFDCGGCLPKGRNVVEINPFAPRSRAQVEAAIAAVKRIEFIPEQSDGVFVPTHALIECVFRLD